MLELYFIVIICTFLGSLTQATFNFGSAIVSMVLWSIISLFVQSANNFMLATICTNLLGMILCVYQTISTIEGIKIHWKSHIIFNLPSLISIPLGLKSIQYLDANQIKQVIGCFVVFTSMYLLNQKIQLKNAKQRKQMGMLTENINYGINSSQQQQNTNDNNNQDYQNTYLSQNQDYSIDQYGLPVTNHKTAQQYIRQTIFIGFITGFFMGSVAMPGMAFGLYFTSINLQKNDFRSIVGFSGIFMISIRSSYIFTSQLYGDLTISLILAIILSTSTAFFVGNTFIYPYIDQEQGNIIILIILIVSGLFCCQQSQYVVYLIIIVFICAVKLFIQQQKVNQEIKENNRKDVKLLDF